MTVAPNQVLVNGQAFQANGAPRMNFVGADADFGSEPESHSIRKPARGVPEDSRAIDAVHEQVCQFA